MGGECTENSVAASSSTPNWWPDLHASSSWSTTTSTPHPWNHPPNPSSNSSCEEDVSISTSFNTTNASNHSALAVESSRRGLVESGSPNEFIGETASDNHLWSQVLLSVGSSGELHNSTQDLEENLLINTLSSKNISTTMFEPACSDYLKKIDNCWEFTGSTPFNNFENHFNGFNENITDSERINKLSNLVSNWSLAPPDTQVNQQRDPQACNISLNSALINPYSSQSNFLPIKSINKNFGSLSSHGNDMKMEDDHHEIEGTVALFRSSFNNNGFGYQMGLHNSLVGDNSKYYFGVLDHLPCNNTRNFPDAMHLNNCLNKPFVDINASKPALRNSRLSDCKRQGTQTSSPKFQSTISTSTTLIRSNGKGQRITNEVKKKRDEENSDTVFKKAKHDSSAKVPKVKVADKITVLQQIVAPFGKTDTASVLGEAIICIKFLQEQVQQLNNSYMKANATKDSWGGLMDRKERGDVKFDLKTRGLCLVPISCTPQVYRENTGSDYWSTPYRGSLYR